MIKTLIESFEDFNEHSNLDVGVRTVCRNLREPDIDEVRGIMGVFNPELLAQQIIHGISGLKWIGYRLEGGEKIMCGVGGFTFLRHGVAEGWVIGTQDFPKVYRTLTKFIIRDILPKLEGVNIHRLQCQSITTHTEAHDWLEMMGAVNEGVLYGYGANREDFYSFSWRLNNVPRQ